MGVKRGEISCYVTLLVSGFVTTFGVSSASYAECYGYDELGRLVSVVYDNADAAERAYNLDEHGNRKLVTDSVSGSGSCSEPTGNTTSGATAGTESSVYSLPEPLTPTPPTPASNSAPNLPAVPKVYSLQIGSSLSIDLLSDITDPDDDPLTVSLKEPLPTLVSVQGLTSDGYVNVTSNLFAGETTIDFTVSDGNGHDVDSSVIVKVIAGGGVNCNGVGSGCVTLPSDPTDRIDNE